MNGTHRRSTRNMDVERAVNKALERIDAFIAGETVELPTPQYRKACDELLTMQAASVKTCVLFLGFYQLENPAWDRKSVPVGSRGQYGDKRLSEELSRRSLTLHSNIKAWGENIGSKSGVGQFRFDTDPRFRAFLAAVEDASPEEQRKIADYIASRFAESRSVPSTLPPVGDDVLTFVRAKALFYNLLDMRSEGHIQQFLIAALLYVFRRKQSIEVSTHHPHAADKFARAAGDIEERQEGRLLRAYEVTVRDDWQRRISGFQQKMDEFDLSKYIIVADNINTDDAWSAPARMALDKRHNSRRLGETCGRGGPR